MRIERGLWATIAVTGTLGLFVLSATVAARLPATVELGAGPDRVGTELSVDVFDDFHGIAPVREAFVRSELRGGLPAFFEARAPSRSGPGPRPREVARAAAVTTAPAADPSGPAPRTADERGTVTKTLAPGDWRLKLGMTANRSFARRGDDILYTIEVRNLGDEAFVGDFTLTSHIPFGTTSSQPAECSLPNGSNNPCGAAVVPVPGEPTPDGEVHAISRSASGVTIEAGGAYVYSFTVTVSPSTPRRARIVNHAHLQTAGEDQQTSPTVTVRVER